MEFHDLNISESQKQNFFNSQKCVKEWLEKQHKKSTLLSQDFTKGKIFEKFVTDDLTIILIEYILEQYSEEVTILHYTNK